MPWGDSEHFLGNGPAVQNAALSRGYGRWQRATETTLEAPLTPVAGYVRDRDKSAAEREERLLALTGSFAYRVLIYTAAYAGLR